MTLEKEIIIDAEPQRIFDALTDERQIPKFFPYEKARVDLEVGGQYVCSGSIDGTPFKDIGYIVSFDEPNEFSYRYWSDNHGTERSEANHLSISYTLTPLGDGTQLRLQQGDIQTDEYFSMMDIAWDTLLLGFKHYVEDHGHAGVT